MSGRVLWIPAILVLSLLMGGGLWVWMNLGAGDEAPQFQSISVDPAVLHFAGGRVVVRAKVIDDIGVKRVSGSVVLAEASFRQLPTKGPSSNSQAFTYVTEFAAPSNVRNDGAITDYLVELVVIDSTGQEAVGQVAFQVAAPVAPPAPPQ